jgi:phosphoribosylaminoimidazolecarboxamide formyltransferase/IMP cyclohydrolase
MPRALLSVSDKSGLVEFARGLAARGFELVSTGGTARILESAGLPVVGISDVTGFPEMMDGRVKTLHPLVHGGILARRGHAGDLEAASSYGITLIDLVVVNLYPFVKTAANPATKFDALVEEIDIGGPSLVRAAAKNFEGVLVVV